MCNSKDGSRGCQSNVAQIDGRPVLQPACNRVVGLLIEAASHHPLKKKSPHHHHKSLPTTTTTFPPPASTITHAAAAAAATDDDHAIPSNETPLALATPPTPPKNKRTSPPVTPKCSKPPPPITTTAAAVTATWVRKRSKKITATTYSSSSSHISVHLPPLPVLDDDRPMMTIFAGGAAQYHLGEQPAAGSIAAAHREHASFMQAQRKMRIAHYGRRTPPAAKKQHLQVNNKPEEDHRVDSALTAQEENRCSFITPNSDPVYVAYHDEEWGMPVHDDKMLFELLVLTGFQIELDWTTILKKRSGFRAAFGGFDAEIVAGFSERQMASISSELGKIDLGRIRGVVNNSKCILQVRKEFGSLDKYVWGFVNHKPVSTRYRSCRKIPVKTAKSETISKDMVRRGFRFVGPTVVHSFMQAAGLTNDHLLTCPRHHTATTTVA